MRKLMDLATDMKIRYKHERMSLHTLVAPVWRITKVDLTLGIQVWNHIWYLRISK